MAIAFMIVVIVFYLLAAGYKSAEAELTIVDNRIPRKPIPVVPRDPNPGSKMSNESAEVFYQKVMADLKANGVQLPPEVIAREARFAKYKKDLQDS